MSDTPEAPAKINLVFYRSASGKEPVRDWLLSQPVGHRRAIGLDLQRVQFRWPVGMPLVRPMGRGLLEVRTSLPDGTISRVLFCFRGGGTLCALRVREENAEDA
jgi:phage-related protein